MAYIKNPVNPKAPSNNALWTKKDDAILKEIKINGENRLTNDTPKAYDFIHHRSEVSCMP